MKKGDLIRGTVSGTIKICESYGTKLHWEVISSAPGWEPMTTGDLDGCFEFCYSDGVITREYFNYKKILFYRKIEAPIRIGSKVTVVATVCGRAGPAYEIRLPSGEVAWLSREYLTGVKAPFVLGDKVWHGGVSYVIKGIDDEIAWCQDGYNDYENLLLEELEHA